MRLPGQPSGPSKAEAWEQLRGLLAPRFGRDGLSPGTRARVRLGLWEVELDVDRETAPRTRLRAPYLAAGGLSFVMRRRGLLSQLGAVLQGQSVPLDDPDLARDFVVQADDPFKIRLLFANPRILELIYAQPVLRLEAPPQADELILEVEGASASMQQVERLFDLFAEALYQLCDLGVADHAAAAAPHPAPESPSETVACFFCGRALAPADARETALAIRHAPLRVLVCGQHAVALASGQRPALRARSVAGRLEPWFRDPAFEPGQQVGPRPNEPSVDWETLPPPAPLLDPPPRAIVHTGDPRWRALQATAADPAARLLLATVAVESGPVGVALTPDGWRAYVTNSARKTIAVIDTASTWVVANPVVSAPSKGVAVSPDGQRVYVTHPGNNSVSVVDRMSHDVLATIPVAASPMEVALSPDGRRAYVACSVGNAVSVLDTASHSVLATLSLPGGAYGVAVTPDGSRVYVATTRDILAPESAVLVIDAASSRVEASIPVGRWAFALAVSPDGAEIYVTNRGGSGVSVIDAASNSVVATVAAGPEPVDVAIHPSGAEAYVTLAEGGGVSIVDTRSRAVVARVPVGLSPAGVAISPDGSCAYVANSGSDTVSILVATPEACRSPESAPGAAAGAIPTWPLGFVTPAQSQAVLGQEGGTGAGIAAERHRFVPPSPEKDP